MPLDAHLVVTDSGLGGLSICAALESRLRAPGGRAVRLTYVNAWPFEGHGYNELPTVTERAEVFDRALVRMATWRPDRILIACNTLSIVYRQTAFARSAPVPVDGIIDAGVDLLAEAMLAEPSAGLILLGTKTTIESGVHHDALVSRGVDPHRMRAVHCHGLAGAIERNPDSDAVSDLMVGCAARAAEANPDGVPLFAGLCCTHYGYVADRISAALGAAVGRPVLALNPNARMVSDFSFDPPSPHARSGPREPRRASQNPRSGSEQPHPQSQPPRLDPQQPDPEASQIGLGSTPPGVSVEVISKVILDDVARQAVARLVEPVSPATARALLSYSHAPDLF